MWCHQNRTLYGEVLQWLLEKRFLALSSLKAGAKSGLALLKYWLLNRRPASIRVPGGRRLQSFTQPLIRLRRQVQLIKKRLIRLRCYRDDSLIQNGFLGSNTSGLKHELGAVLSPGLGRAINQTSLFGVDPNVQGFTLGLASAS